jgi:pyruvate formate-lyase activating enzyme-like uncharacterized protein
MLKEEDDLSWLARKADVLRQDIPFERPGDDAGRAERVSSLLDRLRLGGIKGSIERRTLYTRRLPPGCRGCLAGKGTNAYVTGLCTRDCFFCFNAKPRTDELVVHGIRLADPEDAPEVVRRYGLRSVGVSGGEPTMRRDRLLRLVRALRSLPFRVRIDLYTNGDRLSDALLAELKDAGVDALRVNLVAREFDTEPLERAMRYFDETAVEVPVIPDRMAQMKDMVVRLDALGVPFLNIHELFACRENAVRVAGEGYGSAGGASEVLQWEPVAEAEEAALSLLLFALENASRLSVYYCSCKTQQDISRRGLRRRMRLSHERG